MGIVPLADVKARLSAYLKQCETEGPIVITGNGKAVGVLLAPMNDEDFESLLLARSPLFQALLAKSRESIQAGKGLQCHLIKPTVHCAIALKGRKIIALGQRPRVLAISRSTLKGSHRCPTLSGSVILHLASPGRCPGLLSSALSGLLGPRLSMAD